MFKYLSKKIKLSTMIYAEVIIMFILVAVIGFVAVFQLINTASTGNEMFSNAIKRLDYAFKVNTNMLEYRLNANKGMSGEDMTSVDNAIQVANKNLDEGIKGYLALEGISDADKELIATINENKHNYDEIWQKVRGRIIANEAIPQEEKNLLAKSGDAIVKSVQVALEATIKSANGTLTSIDSNVSKATVILILIIAFSAAILILFSIIFVVYIKRSVSDISEVLDSVSKLDFTVDIPSDQKNEFGLMKANLKKTVDEVGNAIGQVKVKSNGIKDQSKVLAESAGQITDSINEVVEAIGQVASGANEQSEKLQNVNYKMEGFSDKLVSIIGSINEVDKKTAIASEQARDSNHQLESVVSAINELKEAFSNITSKVESLSSNITRVSKITEMINTIAEQTNLIALNAAIEAARAGESGRGFSVVAEEVRKLAEQSKNSVSDIKDIIEMVIIESESMEVTSKTVEENLDKEVKIMENAVLSFKQIIDLIGEIAPKVLNISKEVDGLNKEREGILEKVEETSSISEEFSATSEEISSASQEVYGTSAEIANSTKKMLQDSLDMIDSVEKFKL
ncbi:MAG: methyl-accepting chemotaxis protein [Clostridium sp.]|uniref:methyl-accepting chemotaxis protein n=1 Tax=Clostridium sp. TaxID=1506 RepID=UPI002FCC2C27